MKDSIRARINMDAFKALDGWEYATPSTADFASKFDGFVRKACLRAFQQGWLEGLRSVKRGVIMADVEKGGDIFIVLYLEDGTVFTFPLTQAFGIGGDLRNHYDREDVEPLAEALRATASWLEKSVAHRPKRAS